MITDTHADPIALQARQMLLRRRDTLLTRHEQREERELQEVEQALGRIEQGRFGTCEACGGAIGRQRLLAVPEARHCLGCSSAHPPGRERP